MKIHLLLIAFFGIILSTMAAEKPIQLKLAQFDVKTTQLLTALNFNFLKIDTKGRFVVEIDGVTCLYYKKLGKLEFLVAQDEIVVSNRIELLKKVSIKVTDAKNYKIKTVTKAKNLHFTVRSPKGENFFDAWPAKWIIEIENVKVLNTKATK